MARFAACAGYHNAGITAIGANGAGNEMKSFHS
jgi:hypothetical protein